MVGNDVVDLGDVDARTGARHPRFDERVFAPSERRRIAASADGEQLRWILWAAKESAYKLARRGDARAVFAPTRFVVELDDRRRGCVRHAGRTYPVRVTLDGDCVHVVATLPDIRDVLAGTRRIAARRDGAASREARELAIAAAAMRLRVDARALTITREKRIPRLRLREGGREVALLSLSHHGRFVAYACAFPGAGAEAAA